MTRITVYDDFSLEKIVNSGQCFRAKKLDEDFYQFVSGNKAVWILDLGGNSFPPQEDDGEWSSVYEGRNIHYLNVSCSLKKWEGFWKDYFDLDRNYSCIRTLCAEKFPVECDETRQFLQASEEAGRGLRILRQDPWEMLITFIISQRKNMPAIAKAVEKLSRSYGHEISAGSRRCQGLSPDGPEPIYTFPTPEELDRASEQDLRNLGLGYRAPYVRDATDKVLSGELDLSSLQSLDDEKLFESLMTVKGVGKKVANCICLFGYGRTGRAPVDVWINRAIEACGGNDPFPAFGEYAGIMQQYVFYYMTKQGGRNLRRERSRT